MALMVSATTLAQGKDEDLSKLFYENSNSTLSPYSQYAWGEICDQSNGTGVGMSGLSQGLRLHNQPNFLNPASYSAIDSMSFVFDAGVSGAISHYRENGQKIKAKGGTFDYVSAIFRVMPRMGVSFGLMPYSRIGYSYASVSNTIKDSEADKKDDTTFENQHIFKGVGDLRQVYVGWGYAPIRNLSVGFNLSYLWGSVSRYVSTNIVDGGASTQRVYGATIQSYKLDLGAQYTQQIDKLNSVTVGATYSNGHEVSNDAYCSDDDKHVYALSIPANIKAGVMWTYNKRLNIGFDYTLDKYGDLEFPYYDDSKREYMMSKQTMDRSKYILGGDWCPNPSSRNYFKRVHYRFGASYTTPYVKINQKDGPREMGASVGFGLPIQNAYNARSVLNVSAQWVNTKAEGMISCNSFRICIGLTFNEQWFAKWKAE